MKTPPFLLAAALLFWGWQTGFLVAGAVMAVVLEGARWSKARWEFSDTDFSRIWTFCSLVFLAAAVYAFTASGGPGDFGGLFRNPNLVAQRNAATAGARTAAALIRWLPMIFFLFVAAQAFSSRDGVPLETISLILGIRWRKARKLGQPLPATRSVNLSYPYLVLCLFAASIHAGEGAGFFWGLSPLLAWALWPQRSRRFSVAVWAAALAVVIALGYFGQRGIGQLQRYLENFNPQWFSRFSHRGFDPMQSQTALGEVGRIKTSGKIVIRLEPKVGSAPAYLREASYRTFKGRTWYAAASEKDFESIPHDQAETTWILLPNKTNTAAVNIASYLPGGKGLLPVPGGSGRLEDLPAYLLRKNTMGAVLADGPGLVIFDAHYGPGLTLDSAANTNDDRAVPERELAALDQINAELHLTEQSWDERLRIVSGFFADKFTYSTFQEPDNIRSTNETALSRFLLRSHSGHCEYFATATVLLLRRSGVPARYATGYAVHEASGSKYVVRQRDAHAWCLVWNEKKKRWQDFDTTPASWVAAEENRASPLQFISDLWSRVSFEFAKFRWGQTRLRQYLLWALVPILALLLYQILFRSQRRRQQKKTGATDPEAVWPGLDSEFYQLEKLLATRSLPRPSSEPLSDWLERAIEEPALAKAKAPLQHLLRLHYRYRFDPQGLDGVEREALGREVKTCLLNLSEN
jgi:hypothetical protein